MAQNKQNDDGLVFQLGEEEETYDELDQFDEMGGGIGGEGDQDGQGLRGLIPGVVANVRPRSAVDKVDPSVFGYDISKLEEKGWAKPGADLTDYFNFGFNERTWRAYCAMQAQGVDSLKNKAEEFITKIVEEHGGSAAGTAAGAAAGAGMYSQLGIVGAGTASGYQGGNAHSTSHPLYKTRLCQAHMEGNCTRGDRCNFAHGPEELRAAERNSDGSIPGLKPRPQNPYMGSGGGAGVLSGPPGGMPPMQHHHQNHHHHGHHHPSSSIGYHDTDDRRSGPVVPTPTTIGVLPLPQPNAPNAAPIMTPAPTMRVPQQYAPPGPMNSGFRMMPATKRERSPTTDVYEKKY